MTKNLKNLPDVSSNKKNYLIVYSVAVEEIYTFLYDMNKEM